MLNISKVETFYGNIQALRGVDVKVNDGEIVALIGSNGAGKSTLLMTISGVNKAATGEILFDNKSIVNMPPHDIVNLGISQVPEGRRIFARLTVEDNLRLGASVNEKGKNFDSISFSKFIFACGNKIVFILGNAKGLPLELIENSDFNLSLSKMTMPHEMANLVLAEQIYRAFSIKKGSNYHR